VVRSSPAWESCKEVEFPSTEKEATTKSLQAIYSNSKTHEEGRRVARAIMIMISADFSPLKGNMENLRTQSIPIYITK